MTAFANESRRRLLELACLTALALGLLSLAHLSNADEQWDRNSGYRTAAPARFVVIAPPVGAVIPVLPPFYTTVWVGGAPYYYANNAYYLEGSAGYVVVNPPPPTATIFQVPPSGPIVQQSPGSAVYRTPVVPLSIYPKNGQSLNQQATDRYECQRWATSQSGYDPSNGPGATEQQTDGYTHGMRACLNARGYTVW
jgi:hypothetical protein